MLPNELESKFFQIFRKWNLSESVSLAMSKNMVWAHQYNHPTHGVLLLDRYKRWLDMNVINRNESIELEKNSNFYTFNAKKSFGHWAIPEVLKQLEVLDNIVTPFGIKNLGHAGYIAGCLKYANIQNHLVLLFTNMAGSKVVRPFNGSDKMMSTSCISASIPGLYGFDMTTTSTSENLVRYRMLSNEKLTVPLVLENNELTYNPADFYGYTPDGYPNAALSKTAIVFNDHKMFHLGLLTEILGGIVADSGTSASSSFHNGCFGLLIKLNDNQLDRIKKYINWLTTSPGTTVSSGKYSEEIKLTEWEEEILQKFANN